MAKLSQISITNPQTPKNISISRVITPIYIFYAFVRRIYIIVSNKNLKQNRQEELRVTLYQKEYPAKLINKGFDFSRKISLEDFTNPSSPKNNMAMNNP